MGVAVPLSDLPAGTAVPDSDLPSATAAPAASSPQSGTAATSASTSPHPTDPAFMTTPAQDVGRGYLKTTAAGVIGPMAGGLRGLWDLALGRGSAQAAQDVQGTEGAVSRYLAPTNLYQSVGAHGAQSGWNPLNWPGVALSWAGSKLGGAAESLGAPPIVSTALKVAPTAAALLAGPAARVAGRDLSPYPVAAEEAEGGNPQSLSAAAVDGGAIPQGTPEPLGPPVKGGLPDEAHADRQALLARVGIPQARQSAVTGDALDAAVDYQLTKYDQPAGRDAAQVFQSERDAMAGHAENLISQTGGTVGMDEDALANRGATIARPFDMLRQWFTDRTNQLYAQADERAAGAPLTALSSVDQMLADPSFQNTLGAKNQQGLLSSVGKQLQFMRENAASPDGFTAAESEQLRQWLNQVWTPDNKWAVGQLKGAIDEDVTRAAGEDIYAQARAIRQLRGQTLDNPKGTSQLFDTDPNTPINRSTPLEKIPDRLTQLPLDQYQNVLSTLQQMPPELQPEAQAALGEIRGHLLNKALQAGTETSRAVGSQLWRGDGVAKVLRVNAGKFRVAFGDQPQLQQGIEDLNNAGQVLKVDQSYPGADAQAANMSKQGMLARAGAYGAGVAGSALGHALGGPVGGAIGAEIGTRVGGAASTKAAEAAALKAWRKRLVPTSPPSGAPTR